MTSIQINILLCRLPDLTTKMLLAHFSFSKKTKFYKASIRHFDNDSSQISVHNFNKQKIIL